MSNTSSYGSERSLKASIRTNAVQSRSSSNRSFKRSVKSNSLSLHSKSGKTQISEPPSLGPEDFLNDVRNGVFTHNSPEKLERQLENVDAVVMFNVLQDITAELAAVKTDNRLLTEFLQKNDPKLLIGLGQHMEAQQTKRLSSKKSSDLSGSIHSPKSVRSLFSKRLMSSSLSMHKSKAGVEYRLNYRAKAEMAEKSVMETKMRIRELEQIVIRKTKLLNAHNDELRMRTAEAEETTRNFELHFFRGINDITFLEKATEKQVERKLSKFVTNWMKEARALLGTLRLTVHTVQEKCRQHRAELVRKSDLYGLLGPVDFELLTIERDALLGTLDNQIAQATAFKDVAGKSSNQLYAEKEVMLALEREGKRIEAKTKEAARNIETLEKEVQSVEDSNNRDAIRLSKLKENLERYEAPGVCEYVEKKDELYVLEKEEKMLLRKTHILNMKLTNLMKQHKKKGAA